MVFGNNWKQNIVQYLQETYVGESLEFFMEKKKNKEFICEVCGHIFKNINKTRTQMIKDYLGGREFRKAMGFSDNYAYDNCKSPALLSATECVKGYSDNNGKLNRAHVHRLCLKLHLTYNDKNRRKVQNMYSRVVQRCVTGTKHEQAVQEYCIQELGMVECEPTLEITEDILVPTCAPTRDVSQPDSIGISNVISPVSSSLPEIQELCDIPVTTLVYERGLNTPVKNNVGSTICAASTSDCTTPVQLSTPVCNVAVVTPDQDVDNITSSIRSRISQERMNRPPVVCNKKPRNQYRRKYRQFHIKKTELESIMNENKTKLKDYEDIIREKLRTVGIKCVVNFKSHFVGCKVVRITAYTLIDNRHFTIKIPNVFNQRNMSEHNSVVSTVYITNDFSPTFVDTVKRTTYIKGATRDKLKCRLINKFPSIIRSEDISNLSPGSLACGNLRDVKSAPVYRKVKSQALRDGDDASDDLSDVEELREKRPDYVLKVESSPFCSILCSKEQIDVLKVKERWVLHLDATGSLVRKLIRRKPKGTRNVSNRYSNKQIYYYAAVVNYKHNIAPVTEMYSSMQTATYISTWLFQTKLFAATRNCDIVSRIERIVTDNSAALMRAVLNAFLNVNTITDYINDCYEHLYAQEGNSNKQFKHPLVLTLCCSHFMKNISKNVSSCVDDNTQSVQIKKWIATLFDMSIHTDIENWFRSFCIVMLSEFNSDKVVNAIKVLNHYCNTGTSDISDMLVDSSDAPNNAEEDYLVKGNKFVNHYQDILTEVKSGIYTATNKCQVPNMYHNENLLNDFMKRCVAFLPLWTLVMLPGNVQQVQRESNGTVEALFGKIKTIVMGGKLHRKCGRVMRLMRPEIESWVKAIKHDIPRDRCALPDTGIVDTEACATEKWGKRKSASTYFVRRHDGTTLTRNTWLNTDSPMVSDNITIPDSFCAYDDNTVHVGESTNTCDNSRRMDSTVISDLLQRPVKRYTHNNVVMQLDINNCSSPENIVICWFKKSHVLDNILRQGDFITLNGEEYVSGDVIDAAIFCLQRQCAKHSTVTFVNNYLMTSIMSKEGKYMADYNIPSIKQDTVLLGPLYEDRPQHWCLLHLDVKQKTFAVYDPFDCSNKRKSLKYIKAFKEGCVRNNLCTAEILGEVNVNVNVNVTSQFPKQKDGHNCGMHVILYASIILGCKQKKKPFNPDNYRVYIQELLLHASEDMHKICAHCGDENSPDGEINMPWVQCDACKYWWHYICISENIRQPLTDYDTKSCYYSCIRCSTYLGISGQDLIPRDTSKPFCEYPIEYVLKKVIANKEDPAMSIRKLFTDMSLLSIERICTVTEDQRFDSNWFEHRKYRITASNFHDVLRRRKIENDKYLVKILNIEQSVVTKAMNYGKQYESTALADSGLPIQKCGLYIHKSGVLAASPDGIMENACVEVKCPYTASSMDLKDFCKSNKYIVRYDPITSKYIVNTNHRYYDQIQGQIYITGVEKAVLIVWSRKSCIKVDIMKDAKWESNLDKLVDYYYTKCIPFIMKHIKENST